MNKQALDSLIERVLEENLPNTVFRIKGSVMIGGERKLVQWVQGDLELLDSDRNDSRLVVVIGSI